MKIGVLGATGAVGRQMIECLKEQNVDISLLKLFASEKSAGKIVKYDGNDIILEKVEKASFKGLDVVLGAVENDLALMYAKDIVDAGAVFIDNSSAFRLHDDVPLVVPEINGDDIKKHQGVIANPNCVTIITLMGVAPINKLSKIKTMIATTFQAVSGAGQQGITELESQMKEIVSKDIDITKNNKELAHEKFKYQIAYNVIPAIGGFDENGFSSEEMKLQNEGRKIMHLKDMRVQCTCVRIPVIRSHSISVTVQTENKLSLSDVRKSIESFDDVILKDDCINNIYPMPLNTTNKDIVEVGRIRTDLAMENGISLFIVGDQIRKGAATNAVQILKRL